MDRFRIWSTFMLSPLALSDELRSLNVSHKVDLGSRQKAQVDCGFAQPRAVIITVWQKGVPKYVEDAVNFIVAPQGMLKATNFPLLKDLAGVKAALLSPRAIKPVVELPSPLGYVDAVAKPSILNKIQTQIYHIQPYKFRKEVQALVLAYMNSKVSTARLKRELKDNLKCELLLRLLIEASAHREAVARLKNQSVEQVALETGIPTFELLYLSKERK